MNERIHELMMEATEDMPEGYYIPGEYFEKFAQLIVQECIDKCEEVVDGGCGSAEDCVEELKEHFGVEE